MMAPVTSPISRMRHNSLIVDRLSLTQETATIAGAHQQTAAHTPDPAPAAQNDRDTYDAGRSHTAHSHTPASAAAAASAARAQEADQMERHVSQHGNSVPRAHKASAKLPEVEL